MFWFWMDRLGSWPVLLKSMFGEPLERAPVAKSQCSTDPEPAGVIKTCTYET